MSKEELNLTREVELSQDFNRLTLFVKGDKGAVQFVIFLGKLLKVFNGLGVKALPVDLGYHSHEPMYGTQPPIDDACPVLNGKPCYYEGSGLSADDAYQVLKSDGLNALWEYLEDFYITTFIEG